MTKHTVLIVEDDSAMMRGLKDNFSSNGYEVLSAMDGETGLNHALNHRPDLIILDVMLPKMNGYDICSKIREAELTVPIIMLTAKGQEENILTGLNLGADDYVTKPFSIKVLLARVNAFLRRQEDVDEIVCFGGFAFNRKSRELTRRARKTGDDETVSLTPKERALLELFVDRSGRALTRETILNLVWRNNPFTTSRSVDRCVNTLRKKLETDASKPLFIKTIRDIGYRFEAS